MVTIEPFHGDRLAVYHQSPDGWVKIAEAAVDFCHAIWAGEIDGISCILAGNRGGKKEILLYTINRKSGGNWIQLERRVVDTMVGTANMIVSQKNGQTSLFAANHGRDEVARYILSLE
jgi:hypothetical protein